MEVLPTRIWRCSTDGDSDTLTWDVADSSWVEGNGPNYYTYFDALSWCNIDQFMNNGGPMTTVNVQLPSGFTNLE